MLLGAIDLSDCGNTLSWLQAWYFRHCDGEWEHGCGVEIGTIDNPGWGVDIDLRDTELEGLIIEPVEIERSDTDWMVFWVKDRKFSGRGGPSNLLEILETFRAIAGRRADPGE